MYPYTLFWEIDLYTVFLCVGIIGAILSFRFLSDKLNLYWKLQNFVVVVAFASIIVGYLSAVLFQAFYDIESRGAFIIDSQTGATFYGGLIGGAACFIALYFGVGYFIFKNNKEHTKSFFWVADIAAASIAIAHGFGRVGCLMAGCCHGKVCDAWYAVYMPAIGAKAVPIQLYEALFLFALFGFFVYRIIKKKTCNLSFYMALYGAWRFFIEYFRSDDRGSTFIEFLSPSQLTALIMIAGAIALFFAQKAIMKKNASAEVIKEAEE